MNRNECLLYKVYHVFEILGDNNVLRKSIKIFANWH